MPFVEDPVLLSKSRLKSDLVAHNVELPPAASKKQVYVELHLKHVDQRQAVDFSSDEDEHTAPDKNEDSEVIDPTSLTDDDLKAALLQHGVKAGPIVATTRALYEKKLRNLLQSNIGKNGNDEIDNEQKGVLYSDSEEEEEVKENEEEEEEEESASEQEETQENADPTQEEGSEAYYQDHSSIYPQCFSISSRLRVPSFRKGELQPKRNSRNALKSSKQSRSHCSQIPVGISRTSSGLGSGTPHGSKSLQSEGFSSKSTQTFSIAQMVEEMESRSSSSSEFNERNLPENLSKRSDSPSVRNNWNQSPYFTPQSSLRKSWKKVSPDPMNEILKEIIPDTRTTPTGIYVTRRRPIKGAAQRPIQYTYPDTPVTPTTFHNQEVERRLLPLHLRIAIFLFLGCVLYLIYLSVTYSESVFDALDSLSLGWESSEEVQQLQSDT